jgi:quinol monooxygenase YgiN
MTATIVRPTEGFTTGINVFTLPDSRRRELLDTLHAINLEIMRLKLPMNVASNFHCGIGAPVVMNYNQYTDRSLGQVLRTIPEIAPLMKRTHDVSDRHEIRWYQVVDVLTPDADVRELRIASDGGAVAAIGILTAAPERRPDLLAELADYAAMLVRDKVAGFLGIAIHRGEKPEHVTSYEQWRSADAYARAGPAAATARGRIQGLTETSLHHLYDVVEVARFDLQRIAAASAATSG